MPSSKPTSAVKPFLTTPVEYDFPFSEPRLILPDLTPLVGVVFAPGNVNQLPELAIAATNFADLFQSLFSWGSLKLVQR